MSTLSPFYSARNSAVLLRTSKTTIPCHSLPKPKEACHNPQIQQSEFTSKTYRNTSFAQFLKVYARTIAWNTRIKEEKNENEVPPKIGFAWQLTSHVLCVVFFFLHYSTISLLAQSLTPIAKWKAFDLPIATHQWVYVWSQKRFKYLKKYKASRRTTI